jgi:hypothetical protein
MRSLSAAAAAAQDVRNQETSDHKAEWKDDGGHEMWFGLHAGLRKAVVDMGIKVPSEIQSKALPEISKNSCNWSFRFVRAVRLIATVDVLANTEDCVIDLDCIE